MNISFENVDKVNALLTIKLEKADYEEKVTAALKDFRKKANMPGFRPGQVPMGLLKKRFGTEITAEEVNKILGHEIYKYIHEQNIKILGEPLPDEEKQPEVDFQTMEDFTFVFDVALAPEFDAQLTKKDTVDYYTITVDEDMVEEQIKAYAQRAGQYNKVDAYQPKDMVKGLLAQLDAEGNTLEGGIQVEGAVMLPDYMKNDEEKAKFDNAKVNDVIVFNPAKAYNNSTVELSSLYNGKQYEGYTMIPVVDDFVQRYNLGSDFVVIADSGLMSDKNVKLLRSAGYKYIIGARIKKESGAMKGLILSTPHEPGVFNDIPYGNGDRLIVGYSEERARKNEHDRNEGVERLRKRYAKGTLTKADINKRGYNKFLSISSGVTVCIDDAKIEEDKVWDGLKGYRTNTDLAADQVYENYQLLWNVERAFRITKGTLEVRPMFHFSEKRIEAHVCICFVALKVYKELERLLKVSGCPYSIDNVLRIAEVIVTLDIDLPENGKTLTKTIYTSKEERDIAYLIETNDWLNKNG